MFERYLGFSAVVLLVGIVFSLSASAQLAPPSRQPELNVNSKALFPYSVRGQWGYMDITGKSVIKTKFHYADRFFDDLAIVTSKAGFGFIDRAGELVITKPLDDPNCHAVRRFSEGLAWFEVKDKYGLINRNREVMVEPKYDDVKPFSGGRAAVNLGAEWEFPGGKWGGKWGFVDLEGKTVIAIEYESVSSFSDGLARVADDKHGTNYIDQVRDFSAGLAAVRQDSDWGLY